MTTDTTDIELAIISLAVFYAVVLTLNRDLVVMMLFHDLLDALLQEAVEGGDLLGDEAMLLKVRANNLPAVVVVNRLLVKVDS